ncbi:MAG TPA: TlpA disulfide reductase family protein [Nocardioides sp.]|nr:TlpA disulfide reductase family protein [Nocardioides sp.]
MRALVAGALVALAVTACSADPQDPGLLPGPAQVDVDTPQLREMKAQAEVSDCEPGHAEPVEGGLPAVTLPCLGGGPDVDLGSLRGPMVVNLWASWCGPCRTEMPVLQRFHERHGAHVPIVGVDYEDVQAVAAMELVQESGVTYPLLADPQAELRGAGPFPGRMGLPLFAFVDEDGRASVVAGGVGSVAELTALVDEHLGVEL